MRRQQPTRISIGGSREQLIQISLMCSSNRRPLLSTRKAKEHAISQAVAIVEPNVIRVAYAVLTLLLHRLMLLLINLITHLVKLEFGFCFCFCFCSISRSHLLAAELCCLYRTCDFHFSGSSS